MNPTPAGDERSQRVLEERARQLARPPEREAPADVTRLVVLQIGEERYGIDIRHVLEIRPVFGLAHIPGLPGFWRGVVNLRGNLCPVLDLRLFLGLKHDGDAREGKVVVASAHGVTIGLLADSVPEVRGVLESEIRPRVADAERSSEILRGVTSDLMSVLDAESLVADTRLVVEQESM